jgi:hypothetical protein
MINHDVSICERLPKGALLFLGAGRVQLAIYRQTRYHLCPRCSCWITGDPSERRENARSLLAGRKGRAYCCRRCGTELGFDGCYF